MKKKIVYTDFQDVSIRGRVAFFSSYLEKIILTKNRRLEDWEVLLTEIWQYTLSDRLDNWHEKMSEYLPESILEDIPFKEKEIVYLSYKDYAYLQILYRNAEEEILYLIKQIFYIGTIELYGGIGEKGFQSLLIIKEVLEYIKYNKLILPYLTDIESFQKFKFSIEYGLGSTFVREQIHSLSQEFDGF